MGKLAFYFSKKTNKTKLSSSYCSFTNPIFFVLTLAQIFSKKKTNFSLKLCLRRIFTSLRNHKNTKQILLLHEEISSGSPIKLRKEVFFLVEKQPVHSRFTLHITVTEWKPNYLSFLRESNSYIHKHI